MSMMKSIKHISNFSTLTNIIALHPCHVSTSSPIFRHDYFPSSSNLPLLKLDEKQISPTFRRHQWFQKYAKKPTRDFVVRNGVDPSGVSPSGPPNILSWIMGLGLSIVVPLVTYKWGPSRKNKIALALRVTEDVAESVEKVAEGVEKVAEEISDHVPITGDLKKAVDFVEDFAETVAKDAEAVDEFIDKVQGEQEKKEKSEGNDAKEENPKK